MRKELGKWLMDIAKYIVTAVIISSLFGDMDSSTVYITGAIAVLGTLIGGLILISDKTINLRRFTRIFRLRRVRLRRRNNNTQNN